VDMSTPTTVPVHLTVPVNRSLMTPDIRDFSFGAPSSVNAASPTIIHHFGGNDCGTKQPKTLEQKQKQRQHIRWGDRDIWGIPPFPMTSSSSSSYSTTPNSKGIFEFGRKNGKSAFKAVKKQDGE